MHHTKINILKERQDLSGVAKTGISLHCHTEYSRERLDFLPHYADKIPIISTLLQKEDRDFTKRTGTGIDFASAFWSPPLSPQSVYDIEKKQIDSAGLRSFVSLTDHDCINGNRIVKDADGEAQVPISLEWTVPFEYGFFHLGVHNLPAEESEMIATQLLKLTFDKTVQTHQRRNDLFSMLRDLPQVLVVLNHPNWDTEMVGREQHTALLKDFLGTYAQWIDAFEFNGFRSWSENRSVVEMADTLGKPVVAGGDRHGSSPNTVINLSDANSFDEFVEEVKMAKHSEIALMPEYERPLNSRQMQAVSEILGTYPEFVETRRRWFDRMFFDINDGQGLVSISQHGWKKGPRWLRIAINVVDFLGSRTMIPFYRLLRKRKDRVPVDMASAGIARPEVATIASQLRVVEK